MLGLAVPGTIAGPTSTVDRRKAGLGESGWVRGFFALGWTGVPLLTGCLSMQRGEHPTDVAKPTHVQRRVLMLTQEVRVRMIQANLLFSRKLPFYSRWKQAQVNLAVTQTERKKLKPYSTKPIPLAPFIFIRCILTVPHYGSFGLSTTWVMFQIFLKPPWFQAALVVWVIF